jgi:hypothetical protein
MIGTPENSDNPFPAVAVTTFGVPTTSVASLQYMRKTWAFVVEYLEKYPDASGGLALSGGHGGGKTFLLNWLGDEAKRIKRRPSHAVYAKADTDNILELYRQILKSISRPSLIAITRKAMLTLGGSRVDAAAATQQASREVESARDLQPAFDQKILDPNEIYLLLQKRIENIRPDSTVSQQIAYAIGILEHPEFGKAAYNWLSGEVSNLPVDMPIQTSLWPPDAIGAPDVAVTALECIAGLYRIAEVPLILFLDQMENFISSDSTAMAQASLLKKWVEQLSGRGALVVMAGTPVAWDRLPRDVAPRLLNRGPLTVGGLNNDETALLVRAYLRAEPGFSTEATATIRNLSGGGNPREILQIAHHVFAKTGGSVSGASEDILIEAAKASDSLRDRATLALQMIDLAAKRLNLSVAPVVLGDQQPGGGPQATDDHEVHLVTGPEGSRLAIVLLTSPDAHAEAKDARKVTELRKQLASLPNQPALLVVTVGYSSARVVSLVSEISRVLEFDENNFQDRVKGELGRNPASVVREASRGASDMSPLLEHLTKLDERLARIEANRSEDQRETAKTLERGSAELAEPERVETEAKTRYQLRFGLDELHSALTDREDIRERRILRRLLVANEANVKDATFDYLGSIYLDTLDSLQLSGLNNVYDTISDQIMDEYTLLRSDLIREMRNKLSSWHRPYLDVRSPLVSSVLIGVTFGLLVGALVFSYFMRYSESLAGNLGGILGSIAGITAGGVWLFFSESMARPDRRYEYFAVKLNDLRSGRFKKRLLSNQASAQ